MAVTYKKLFHMLIDRNMSPAQLQQAAGYSANISTRLRRDYYVSLESVEKICRVLNCKVDAHNYPTRTQKREENILDTPTATVNFMLY